VDREHILGLEKVVFSIKAKFCHKAKGNVRLFSFKKKWCFGFFVVAHFSFVFSAPFKNEKSRVHFIHFSEKLTTSIFRDGKCTILHGVMPQQTCENLNSHINMSDQPSTLQRCTEMLFLLSDAFYSIQW
jgi:hypothetical protein